MDIRSTDNPQEIVSRLRREPLRNIVLLKHIEAYPRHVSAVQVHADQRTATLVLLDTRASAYDRETYPAAAFAALISSDAPSLTRRLMTSVPDRCEVVFKLASDADRDVIAAHRPLHRATSFLSFTTTDAAGAAMDEQVIVSRSPSDAALDLFETQGHSRQWLRPLLVADRGFACILEGSGIVLSACIAFEIDGPIWEIGGVVTPRQHRGRGHASRVVRTALAELHRRSLVPRYQVNEENLASIGLARSVGLRQFLQLTHFRTW